MRKLVVVALAFTMLASFAPQAHSIGAFLSWWDGKDTDSGFGLGVNHRIDIIPLVGVDVRVSWLNYSDADFNMFPLEAMGYVKLGLFYGGLGLGYYMADSTIKNTVGGFILGGGGIELAGLGVFGELKYTYLKPKLDVVGEPEIDASGFGINVGVTLPFF